MGRRIGLRRRLATRLGPEEGFTVVEVLVTVMVLSVGLLAVVGPLESADRTAYNAQRSEQIVSFGQREIERLRGLSYAQLGHAQLPSSEASGTQAGDNNPVNPNFYVINNADGTRNFKIMANYRDSTSGPAAGTTVEGEPLVSGGTVTSGETFAVAGLTGRIYRYVSWRRESCPNCDTNGQNSKRVTVALAPDAPGNGAGPSKPIWLTTVVTDPRAVPPGKTAPTANPGSGPAVSAQPFFLHDVNCKVGYGAGDQLIQKPKTHPTHNTSQSGTTCANDDSPDAMSNVAPRTDIAVLENYSSDLARTAPTGGLVLKPFDSACPTSYTSTDASTRKWSIHTWATPSFAAGFKTPTTGARTALSFWTQTVNGASGGATMCLSLRSSASSSTVLASTTYTQANWPREPTELSFAFDHAAFTVPQNERLYMTVSIKSDSSNDIALLYDHPSYASFLTVATTTPLG